MSTERIQIYNSVLVAGIQLVFQQGTSRVQSWLEALSFINKNHLLRLHVLIPAVLKTGFGKQGSAFQ